MPDEQLNTHLPELADEVKHLGQFFIDPPPQVTAADPTIRDEAAESLKLLEG